MTSFYFLIIVWEMTQNTWMYVFSGRLDSDCDQPVLITNSSPQLHVMLLINLSGFILRWQPAGCTSSPTNDHEWLWLKILTTGRTWGLRWNQPDVPVWTGCRRICERLFLWLEMDWCNGRAPLLTTQNFLGYSRCNELETDIIMYFVKQFFLPGQAFPELRLRLRCFYCM